MATQILDTETWTEISPLIAIALCEGGQVWVSVFPSIKWDCNYPPCKIIVRSRDNIFKVPHKVCGMEYKLLNGNKFDDNEDDGGGGTGDDDDYTNQDAGSGFVVYLYFLIFLQTTII